MILFCSDLDNTLIYSNRHEIGGSKSCVEIYQGREVSFMTQKSIEMLGVIRSQALFVPVTTRTLEQYERIRLGEEPPEYALICNGGLLLERGKRDGEWYEESLDLVSGAAAAMDRAFRCLEEDPDRNFEIRNIEGLFLFTKSLRPERTMARLNGRLAKEPVRVSCLGEKMYVIPKHMDKGTAVRRLKEKLGGRLEGVPIAAAGDSEFDLSMLAAADTALVPAQLQSRIQEIQTDINHAVLFSGEAVFSDQFLAYLAGLMQITVR